MIERFALRPLIGQPILSLIAVTLGIAYFIGGVVSFIWPLSIGALPKIFPQEPVHIGNAVISQEYIWAAGISLVVFGLLTLFYKYHRMGIAMRATADDQMAVQACGIPVTSIFSMSWMFACVVAAIGGILISSIGGISYGLVETGLQVILGGDTGRAGLLYRCDGRRSDYRPGRESGRRLSDSLSLGRNQGYYSLLIIIIIVVTGLEMD